MRLIALLALAFAALPASAAASSTVDLTAFRTRIGDHPGFVRVVVDFTDGTMATNDSEAIDPDPFDGDALVEVRHRRVQAQAPTVDAHGVRVRVVQGTNRIRVRIRARVRRFKYLARTQLRNPERLVIDLYKSRPPVAGAEIPRAPDGCLRIVSRTGSPGRIRVHGTAQNIFENQFQLVVRGRDGRVKGRRSVLFGPSGRWTRTVRFNVARRQAGTLEAVEGSARDGALACLAQVRVTLRP
jgi:hypothetical protein